MKFRRFLCACFAVALLAVIACAPALAKVVSPGKEFYFLDKADVLSEATKGEIFFSNELLYEACGAQFVVVTLDTTGSTAVDDYAYDLFNQWQIGDSSKQNGFLLLLAIDDDTYTMQPGTGLQSKLTAGSLRTYVDRYLEPEFANHDYDRAVRLFFEAIFARIADTYNAEVTTDEGIAAYQAWAAEGSGDMVASTVPSNRRSSSADDGSGMLGMIVLILIVVLIIALISRRRRRASTVGTRTRVLPIFFNSRPYEPPRGPMGGPAAGPGGYRGTTRPASRPTTFGGTTRPSGGLFGGGSTRSSFGSGSTSRSSSSSSSSSRSSFGSVAKSIFSGSSSRSSGGSRSFGSARGGGGGTRGGGITRGRH